MKKGLVFSLMLLFCPLFVGAQVAINTSLVGTVTDATGGAIVGAHVTAVNADTKVPFDAVTNAEGYYDITGQINPGTYNITVEEAGFSKEQKTGVILTLNLSVRTDFALKPGATSTEVTVSANTPAIQTDDSLLGETVSETMIADLPMNGRNALDLAGNASNVYVSADSGALTGVPPGQTVSGAGTRGINNSITLDGISIMNDLITTVTVSPNPDALGAVQSQVGNYTAQYGDYLGAHVNEATKSGTNSFHGVLFETIQNDAFNSQGFNHNAILNPKTHFRQNIFGGVLSGPVTVPWLYSGKDKLFFMGSYQGLRQQSISTSLFSTLTPALLSGDYSIFLNPTYNGTVGSTPKDTLLYSPYDGHAYYNLSAGTQQINDQPAAIKTIYNKIIAYAPPANRLNPGDTTGNATVLAQNAQETLPTILDERQTVDRLDFNPTEKDRFFGRFDWQRQDQIVTNTAYINDQYTPTWARNAAAGYTRILTPNLVNDLRAGFNWIQTDGLNYDYTHGILNADTALGIPGYNYGTPSGNLGTVDIGANIFSISQGSTNWIQDDRTLQAYDQISWTKNKHSIMGGVDLRRLTIGRVAANAGQGTIGFAAAQTGLACASCTAPTLPTGVGSTLGQADASLFTGVASTDTSPLFQVKSADLQWRDGFFVQDTWQFSKRLTLELGFRYELPLVASSLNGNVTVLDPTLMFLIPAPITCATPQCQAFKNPGFKFTGPNHKDLAPRFGFSYRVTDRIVVRGGGGIYYNELQLNAFTLTDTNYPFSSTANYGTPTDAASLQYGAADQAVLVTLANPSPGNAKTVPIPGPGGTPGSYLAAFGDAYHLPSEQMQQWNLDNGIQLWKNAGLELQYLGSHSIHLDESNYAANQPQPTGAAPDSQTTGSSYINPHRPDQNFGQKRVFVDDSAATYEALTTVFRQRLSHGLSASVSYTWAHSFDEVNNADNSGSAMWQGHLKLEYGPSTNGDIRNNVVTAFTYALPSFAHSNYLVQEAAGGWQVNGVVTMQSAPPINISTGTDWADTAVLGAAQRMNWAHPGNDRVGAGCTKKVLLTEPYGSNTPSCIDATAYAIPQQYTYGNMHRNDLRGVNGAFFNNLSLFKTFKLYEQVNFQLRMEAFNALNHANMGNPGGSFTITAQGTAAAPLPPTDTQSGTFGQAGIATGSTSPARTVQLGGRLNF